MSRQIRNGTWETLADCTAIKAGQKELSYKETKWIIVGRESDETIVPMIIVQDNAIVGKGLNWITAYEEKRKYVLRKLSNI